MNDPEQDFAIVGDGQFWRWFSQPKQRVYATSDFSDAIAQVQSLSQTAPVTFAIDYEASISNAYPDLQRGGCVDAMAWGQVERLSLAQVVERLPTPASSWSWALNWTPEVWRRQIQVLKEYLEAGDCYQGNLTLRGHGECDATPAALWHALLSRQPVPYGALMPWGEGAAISLSPELLWRVSGGRIECQPMKGTIGLGASPDETQTLADWLRSDPKNRAENLMILDLIRNDLGQIAKPGSVQVPESFEVKPFATLQQMVSTVTAELATSNFSDWVRALMPYGSITGAPKKRSVEVLSELEDTPRGLYTGSCGFVQGDESVANVAIRTATLQQGRLVFGVGGGITLDSQADDEWEEALLKTRFIQPPKAVLTR